MVLLLFPSCSVFSGCVVVVEEVPGVGFSSVALLCDLIKYARAGRRLWVFDIHLSLRGSGGK